jgi:hypothetical protein
MSLCVKKIVCCFWDLFTAREETLEEFVGGVCGFTCFWPGSCHIDSFLGLLDVIDVEAVSFFLLSSSLR